MALRIVAKARVLVSSRHFIARSRRPVEMCTAIRRTSILGMSAIIGYVGSTRAFCQATDATERAPVEDELIDVTSLLNWNADWDSRCPQPGQTKPIATRHLVLIRHGHYNNNTKDESEMKLTNLGKQQAQIMAKYVAHMPWTPTRVFVSDMTRAKETLQALEEELTSANKKAPTTVLPSLREGRPCQPVPLTRSGAFKKVDVENDGPRIEEAFHAIFHRADVTQTEDSFEVVVGHANVFRYFVCRALQLPEEAWGRMSLAHCSVTVLAIRPSGTVIVRTIGNTHSLPAHYVTYY